MPRLHLTHDYPAMTVRFQCLHFREVSAGQPYDVPTIESSVEPPIINIHFYIDHSNLHIS